MEQVRKEGKIKAQPNQGLDPDTHICKERKCIRAKRALKVLVRSIENTVVSPEYISVFQHYQKSNDAYNGPMFVKELGMAQSALNTFRPEEFDISHLEEDKVSDEEVQAEKAEVEEEADMRTEDSQEEEK